jgi:dolichol-phosphate mannosyltransferase
VPTVTSQLDRGARRHVSVEATVADGAVADGAVADGAVADGAVADGAVAVRTFGPA